MDNDLIGTCQPPGPRCQLIKRPFGIQLASGAGRLTSPYQVIIQPGFRDPGFIERTLEILTAINPFTPLELIFLEPQSLPDTAALLPAARLRRPHFLDLDLRYLFPKEGNRAVLFTLVSKRVSHQFKSEMERQVFWWQGRQFPEMDDLQALSALDGVLVDVSASNLEAERWQDRFAGHAADIPFISFADVGLQKRWLLLTMPDDYVRKVLNWVSLRS